MCTFSIWRENTGDARIFVRRHNLFREAGEQFCDSKALYELRVTDNFLAKWRLLSILSSKYFSQHAFGEDHLIFFYFSRGIFSHIMHLHRRLCKRKYLMDYNHDYQVLTQLFPVVYWSTQNHVIVITLVLRKPYYWQSFLLKSESNYF